MSAASQHRLVQADRAEVAGVHGNDNDNMVAQVVNAAARATDGNNGFQASTQ